MYQLYKLVCCLTTHSKNYKLHVVKAVMNLRSIKQ